MPQPASGPGSAGSRSALAAHREGREGEAAVDREPGAGDVGGGVGDEEGDDVGDLAGVAKRSKGTASRARSRTWSGIASTFSVATMPGRTALTVTSEGAISTASVRTIPSRPALLAA